MKTLLALAAASLLTISGSSIARAQGGDMSTVTCAELLEMNKEDASMFLIWLDGWLAGQADDTRIDTATMVAQIEGIAAACQAEPTLSVMNAAKEYLEEDE